MEKVDVEEEARCGDCRKRTPHVFRFDGIVLTSTRCTVCGLVRKDGIA